MASDAHSEARFGTGVGEADGGVMMPHGDVAHGKKRKAGKGCATGVGVATTGYTQPAKMNADAALLVAAYLEALVTGEWIRVQLRLRHVCIVVTTQLSGCCKQLSLCVVRL